MGGDGTVIEIARQLPFFQCFAIVAYPISADSYGVFSRIIEFEPAVEVSGRTHIHVCIGRHEFVDDERLGRSRHDIVVMLQQFELDVIHHQPVVVCAIVVVYFDHGFAVGHIELYAIPVSSCTECHCSGLHRVRVIFVYGRTVIGCLPYAPHTGSVESKSIFRSYCGFGAVCIDIAELRFRLVCVMFIGFGVCTGAI